MRRRATAWTWIARASSTSGTRSTDSVTSASTIPRPDRWSRNFLARRKLSPPPVVAARPLQPPRVAVVVEAEQRLGGPGGAGAGERRVGPVVPVAVAAVVRQLLLPRRRTRRLSKQPLPPSALSILRARR